MDVGETGARCWNVGEGRPPFLTFLLCEEANGSLSRNMYVDALSNSSLVAELGAGGSTGGYSPL